VRAETVDQPARLSLFRQVFLHLSAGRSLSMSFLQPSWRPSRRSLRFCTKLSFLSWSRYIGLGTAIWLSRECHATARHDSIQEQCGSQYGNGMSCLLRSIIRQMLLLLYTQSAILVQSRQADGRQVRECQMSYDLEHRPRSGFGLVSKVGSSDGLS